MIRGNKVTLTALDQADSDTLFAWMNDPELVHNHSFFRPVPRSSHDKWFAGVTSDPSTVILAIRDQDCSRLVGMIQLVSIHPIHRSAELRIKIGATADRGRGLGSEAVRLICDFGFRDLNLVRIFLHVFANNAKGIGAYRRAGFEDEGVMRKAAYVNGEWLDVRSMAKLA